MIKKLENPQLLYVICTGWMPFCIACHKLFVSMKFTQNLGPEPQQGVQTKLQDLSESNPNYSYTTAYNATKTSWTLTVCILAGHDLTALLLHVPFHGALPIMLKYCFILLRSGKKTFSLFIDICKQHHQPKFHLNHDHQILHITTDMFGQKQLLDYHKAFYPQCLGAKVRSSK